MPGLGDAAGPRHGAGLCLQRVSFDRHAWMEDRLVPLVVSLVTNPAPRRPLDCGHVATVSAKRCVLFPELLTLFDDEEEA